MLADLLKATLIGFAIAAPVGPIGILCIQRSLQQGILVGFASGLGAATADTLYGLIGALGLTALSALLVSGKIWLSVFGIVFLSYLGIKTLLAKPSGAQKEATEIGAWRAYTSTVLLTLANPMTILSFIGIFASLATANTNSAASPAIYPMVIGIFLGSAAWWLLLSGSVALIRERLSENSKYRINQVAGIILLGFALYQVAQWLK